MKIERMQSIEVDKKSGCAYAAAAARDKLGMTSVKVRYLGGGSFGRAYEVVGRDGSVVVKLLADREMMRKETHDLGLLASACPIAVPRVLFAREEDGEIPFACYGMQRIEGGSALTSLPLWLAPRRVKQAFADEVTTALHAVHGVTCDRYGDTLSPQFGDWLDLYRPFASEVFEAARADSIFDKSVIAAMGAAMDVFDKIFAQKPDAPRLIHGDLNIANIMTKNRRVTGFIDPLNSMYADREYDLFQFRNLWGERFKLVGSYVSKYGASEKIEYKLAFYGLFNEVWCSIKVGYVIPPIMKPLVKRMDELASKLR